MRITSTMFRKIMKKSRYNLRFVVKFAAIGSQFAVTRNIFEESVTVLLVVNLAAIMRQTITHNQVLGP